MYREKNPRPGHPDNAMIGADPRLAVIIDGLVEQCRPELPMLEQDDLPKDSHGDSYIPLSETLAEPIPFDMNRPGKGVMIHVFDKGDRELDPTTLLDQLKRQGFLSPRRLATFSTLPMGWGVSPERSLLVYRSYTCWSKEYDNNGYMSWVEGVIGVPQEQANAISAQAVEYHKRVRGHRTYLEWDVWSYVPPKHLLGSVDINAEQADQLYRDDMTMINGYSSGKVAEDEAIQGNLEAKLGLNITGLEGDLDDKAKKLFWLSYCGTMTENALVRLIYEKEFNRQQLAQIQPRYPWTQKLQSETLRLIGSH